MGRPLQLRKLKKWQVITKNVHGKGKSWREKNY